MRFKLSARLLLFAGLCICLTSGEMWLNNAHPFNTYRIAFTFSELGNAEIYVMDSDGGNQENLTNHPAYDGFPDWSPDGTKIAFVSTRDKVAAQIYTMDADGKNPIRLTDGPRHKSAPDWSPDGGKIAFTVHPDFGVDVVHHIDVMDADGKNRKRLEDFAEEPSWSPNGGEIAFVSWRAWANDKANEIYVISADGQKLKRVTHDLANQHHPSFSPAGGQIAYYALDKEFDQIYVIDTDGTNRVRLTHEQQNHGDPAWSPDGQTITYRIQGGDLLGTIHLMTADGIHLKKLRDNHGGSDSQPDVSPLGLTVSPASNKSTIWGSLKKVELNHR